MKAYDETSEFDREELACLNAAPWMLQCLAMNPSYPYWGPGDDYMRGDGDGWDSRISVETWSEFDISLDDMNEVVHFYFEIERASKDCDTCSGSGYHPHAKLISDSFYRHCSPFRMVTRDSLQRIAEARALYGTAWAKFEAEMMQHYTWRDRITDDEADALVEAGRLFDLTRHYVRGEGWVPNDPPTHPTGEQVNAWERSTTMGHDSINQAILVRVRCERMGIPLYCEACEGHGSIYTEPAAKMGLVLWLLHPRKGASRGVHVREVTEADLPSVYAFLRTAAQRNADRFAKIPTF